MKGKHKTRKTTRKRQRTSTSHEQSVKQEIVKLTKSVRNKYRDLLRSTEDAERYLQASTKPLVSPLQKTVAESIKQSIPLAKIKSEAIEVKKELKSVGSGSGDEYDEEEGELNKTVDTSTQTEESLVEGYLRKYNSPQYRGRLDLTYGVRLDGKGGTLIGDSPITFSKSKVIVKDHRYQATPGLLELLFMQLPKKQLITPSDLSTYKQILEMTSAHKQNYSVEKPINGNKGKKYTTVIQELFLPKRTRPGDLPPVEGRGLADRDLNSLVNRLRLLYLSQNAGHTGHSREIAGIIDLLRLYKVIL